MREGQFYVANVSTFPPRKCGIGSFAKDMIESFLNDPNKRVGEWIAYPIVGQLGKAVYPPRYRMHMGQEILQEDPASFESAARSIVNLARELRGQGTDIGVFLNHEYGVFAGHHTQDNAVRFLDILSEGDVASMVVGHTVLTDTSRPDWRQKRDVMVGMINSADKFICITPYALQNLMNPDFYFRLRGDIKETVPRGKLIEIAHGIPEINVGGDRAELKRKYGFVNQDGSLKKVFTSVGFLSPSKGLEYVIDGYLKVLRERSDRENIVYFIAGQTHDEILRQEGEQYRESLIERVKDKGIRGAIMTREEGREKITDIYDNKVEGVQDANLVFLNTHLSDEELLKIMKMSDCGVIGNLGKEQISSGPGTYWIGSGRITIATASPFFKDMESQGIGLLVPFRDSEGFYDRMMHVLELSDDDTDELEHIASDFGSANTWTITGQKYLNVMEKLIRYRASRREQS